ncbi:hypothetical protein [Prevotella sp. ne3005]|uniref:hypothetical protein n=1 Tax=Prevotella sp. ne3005 TaxID=1761887 RepID=UPI00147ABBF5|nr:hypothetical protein [Prevotella sp. ne3005]
MINDSTAIVLQEEVIAQKLDSFSKSNRNDPNKYIVFGMMDCTLQNLARRAWDLMNRGMQGVAISCDKLHTLQISLTSKKMMQLFRIMEDRNSYLLISLGDEDSVLEELKQVVAECKRLKVVLWDTHLIVN